jgi:hypothetical protein
MVPDIRSSSSIASSRIQFMYAPDTRKSTVVFRWVPSATRGRTPSSMSITRRP